ncbi:MAG: hypothetical protein KAR30_01760, partial [Gammaproteobacteria bacterium]|nr:hypothetical protein [Gammaproteobacteria bacterium]
MTIGIDGKDDPPVLDLNPGDTGSNDISVSYTEGQPAVALMPASTISDTDSTSLTSAAIIIPNPRQGDVLSIAGGAGALPAGITVQTQSNTSMVLQSSQLASIVDYQIALGLIQYQSTASNPDPAARTIAVVINDETFVTSNTAYVTVNIIVVNDPPTLDLDFDGAGTGYAGVFVVGNNSTEIPVVDTDVTITDDSAYIAQATATITNAQPGDQLSASGLPAGISIDAASTSSNIILTGNATAADYQTALASVRFNNILSSPANVARSIDILVTDDGAISSPVATTALTLEYSPVVDLNGDDAVQGNAGQDFTTRFIPDVVNPLTQPSIPVVDTDVIILDQDSANLDGLVIEITNPKVGDKLSIDDAQLVGITLDAASTDDILVLTGTTSLANYEQALQLIGYRNTQFVPDPVARTITFAVTDTSGRIGRVSTTTVSIGGDFAVSFEQIAEVVLADESLIYTINVTNVGSSVATDIVLTSVLAQDAFVLNNTGSGWDCNDFQAGQNPNVVCSLPLLGSGQTTQVSIEIMTPSVNGKITNTVSVTSSDPSLGTGSAIQENLVVNFSDNGFRQGEKITDMDPSTGTSYESTSAGYGKAIAIHGDVLFVGSPGANSGDGVVSMYTLSNNGWSLVRRYTNPDTGSNNKFGTSVAYDGVTLVIGAPISIGKVHIYDPAIASTVPVQALTTGVSLDDFGMAVAVSGNRIVVGAPGWVNIGGRAYVYDYTGSSWDQTQTFDPSPYVETITQRDDPTWARFGSAVALQGNTMVIGAPGYITEQGVALVYEFANGAWLTPQALLKPFINVDDDFGQSIAIDGKTIVVGSRVYDPVHPDSGSVDAFVRGNDGQWIHQQKIMASDAVGYELFGASVALQGDTLLVGAPKALTPDAQFVSGAAYVFQRTGAVWNQQQKVLSSDIEQYDVFGTTVALYGKRAIVGVPQEDSLSPAIADSGAVYVFSIDTRIENKLVAFDQDLGDMYGYAVAVSGDTLVVGASDAAHPELDPLILAGAVYVYRQQNEEWVLEQQLMPDAADVGALLLYGIQLDIDGDVLAVATSGGPVHVYRRFGTTWIQEAKLVSPDDRNNSILGRTITVRGDMIVIASESNGINNDSEGIVDTYVRSVTGSWDIQTPLLADDAVMNTNFGRDIAFNANGARMAVSSNVGNKVYIYEWDGASSWIKVDDINEVDEVTSIAIATNNAGEDVLAIGMSGRDKNGIVDSGSVTLYNWVSASSNFVFHTELIHNDALTGDYLGASLDALGSRIIVGAAGGGTNAESGAAYVFVEDPDLGWVQAD